MSPSNLRGVAYWVMVALLLFTGLGAVALADEEEPAAPPAARSAR